MEKPKRKSNKLITLESLNEGASTYNEIAKYAQKHGKPDFKREKGYAVVQKLGAEYIKFETGKRDRWPLTRLSLKNRGKGELRDLLANFKMSEEEKEQRNRHNFRNSIREQILLSDGITTTEVVDNLKYETLGGRKRERYEIIEEIKSMIDSEEVKFSKGELHYSKEHFIKIVKTWGDAQIFIERELQIPFEETIEKYLNSYKEKSMRYIKRFLEKNTEHYSLEGDIFNWFVEEEEKQN